MFNRPLAVLAILATFSMAMCLPAVGSAAVRVSAYDPLASEFDIGSQAQPRDAIEIYAAGNGSFAGKAVIVSDGPILGAAAKLGPMVGSSGQGRLASSCAEIRYAAAAGPTGQYDALQATCPRRVDVLTAAKLGRGWKSTSPAVGEALLPIWVIFNLPATVQPGTYEGKLIVTTGRTSGRTSGRASGRASGSGGRAERFAVPVRLHVAAWTLPDPHDYRTFVELIESPESVAMQYGVPLWSARHFKLIAKSLHWMGLVGNKTVYIPLICRTNFGNSQSMVRWIKSGRGYKYDFSVMEKYIDAVIANCGRPQVVVLYVWDTFLAGGMGTGRSDDPVLRNEPSATRTGRAAHRGKGPSVTSVSRSGRAEMITLPPYRDPDSQALWKPLLAGVTRRLADRGLGDATPLGIVTDVQPARQVVEFFHQLMPAAQWVRRGHMRIKSVSGVPLKVQFGPSYNIWAYDLRDHDRMYGWRGRKWQYPGLSVHFPRSHRDYTSRCVFRLIGEANIVGAQRGFGGYGADFWPVVKDKRGRSRGRLAARYPESSWRNLNIQTALLAPGPDGAVPTARYQMMREGVQECEARIFIEQKLLDPTSADKLGDELVRHCRAILDERIAAMKSGMKGSWAYSGFQWETKRLEYTDFINSGWAARSGKLFAAAGLVAQKLKTD